MAGLIRVVVVAPTYAVRAGLRVLLGAGPGLPFEGDGAGSAIQVVYEAARLGEVELYRPEADLLLITAEALDEPDLSRCLQALGPGLAILLVGDDPDDLSTLANLPVRAWGMAGPEVSPEEMQAGVRAVHEGFWVAPPALVARRFQRPVGLIAGQEEVLIEPLTERESEVLQLLARGLPNKQAAIALGISENTVKFHVASIYTKLGASNRAEAIRLGVQLGLILL